MAPLPQSRDGGTLLSGEEEPGETYWRSRSRPRVTPPPASIPVHVKAGVTLSIALSWVLTTELAAAAQDAGFGGYTLLYVSTSMLSLFNCNAQVRWTVLEPRRGGQAAVSWAVPGFLVLWLACNLAFLLALTLDRPTTVTAVFSTNPAFVYVMSVCVLKEPHDFARVFAVCLAIGGVYLTTKGAEEHDKDGSGGDGHDDGDDGDDGEQASQVVVGSALVSAALAALYKVLFYFTYGEATPLQVSSFLGKLGVLNLGTGWVLLMVLWASGYQDMPSAHSHPTAWGLAALYALASVSFNFSINLGVARTYPLFVSLGTVLGIPVAVAADCSLLGWFGSKSCRDLLAWPLPSSGYVCVALAFVLLLARDGSYKLGRAGQLPRDQRTGRRVEGLVAAPPGASLVSAYSSWNSSASNNGGHRRNNNGDHVGDDRRHLLPNEYSSPDGSVGSSVGGGGGKEGGEVGSAGGGDSGAAGAAANTTEDVLNDSALAAAMLRSEENESNEGSAGDGSGSEQGSTGSV